jgi:hypothetical protein
MTVRIALDKRNSHDFPAKKNSHDMTSKASSTQKIAAN